MASNKITVLITGNASQLHTELSKTTSMLEKSFGSIGSMITGALSVGAIVAMAKSATQMGSDLSHATEKFGIGAERLSELRYAAQLADVDFQGLGKALKFMAKNAAEAATGSVDSNNAFRAMGIYVKDATGNLKPAAILFDEVAKKMSEYKDSAEKTALVLHLFGRAGADIIPVLNKWGESSEKLKTEAEKLGLVFSDEQVKKLEKYEQAIKKIEMAMKGLAGKAITEAGEHLEKFWNAPWYEKALAVLTGGNSLARLGASGQPLGTQSGKIADILVANPDKKTAPLIKDLNAKFIGPIDASKWELSLDLIAKRYEELANTLNLEMLIDYGERFRSMSDLMKDFGDDARNGLEAALTAQQMYEDAVTRGDAAVAIQALNDGLMVHNERVKDAAGQVSSWVDAWGYANKSFDGYMNDISFATLSAFNSMADVITEFLVKGKASFANFRDAVISDLMKIAVHANITAPLARGLGSIWPAFGGGGSGMSQGYMMNNLMSDFGGGRASGGPVSAGTMYLIGERGPEIFAPGVSGSVIPNAGGKGDVTVNIRNEGGQPVEAKSSRATLDAQGMIIDIVLDGINRNVHGLRTALGGA